jgi:DtxR family transcriptional regulator, Mn-dependent transcriptional regulator
MTDRAPEVSDEVLEDCLQAVHRSALDNSATTIETIAAFARISPALTEAALGELGARGLLEDGYPRRITLTPDGVRMAAGVVRRHRLSERLLTDVLGVPWDRAHEHAMRLEHALDADSAGRLEALLNNPETCPHGAPIPSDQGQTRERLLCGLDRITPGTRVRIARVLEEAGEFLRHLASLGLLPQADLIVEEVAPFGGPLLVRVGDARYAIGREVAAKILVADGAVSR